MELRGVLGFKGERGYSAYEIAVQKGFRGTEQDWLATLGTSSHLEEHSEIITVAEQTDTFTLPNYYSEIDSILEVFVDGTKIPQSDLTIGDTTVTLKNPVEVSKTVELYITKSSTNELPIVTVIDEEATDKTAPSTKSVYTLSQALKAGIDENSNGISKINDTAMFISKVEEWSE